MAICGDAAHPMMPNLGQGGCQSTEDGYRLIEELATVTHTDKVWCVCRHTAAGYEIQTKVKFYLKYFIKYLSHTLYSLPGCGCAWQLLQKARVAYEHHSGLCAAGVSQGASPPYPHTYVTVSTQPTSPHITYQPTLILFTPSHHPTTPVRIFWLISI